MNDDDESKYLSHLSERVMVEVFIIFINDYYDHYINIVNSINSTSRESFGLLYCRIYQRRRGNDYFGGGEIGTVTENVRFEI